jgi:hypothetical protein
MKLGIKSGLIKSHIAKNRIGREKIEEIISLVFKIFISFSLICFSSSIASVSFSITIASYQALSTVSLISHTFTKFSLYFNTIVSSPKLTVISSTHSRDQTAFLTIQAQ